MSRWSHLHSVLAGAIGGLLLTERGTVLALAALVVFLLGVTAGRFWWSLVQAGRIVNARWRQ